MKRLSLLVVMVAFVFGLVMAALPAYSVKADYALPGYVVAGQLNIRVSPKISNNVLKTLNWGAHVTILGRNARGNFAKIIAADGTIGWASIYWIRLSKNIPYATLPVVS